MWQLWLVWILTTKRKSLERVENFMNYKIFSCYYWLIYSIQTVFILLCLLVIRYILQAGFYSPDIQPFNLFPHWTLIVHLSVNDVIFQIYEMMPRFLFCKVNLCFHTFLTTEGVIIPFDLHCTVMVKIINSCLCSPVVAQSAMRQDMSHFTLLPWLTRC